MVSNFKDRNLAKPYKSVSAKSGLYSLTLSSLIITNFIFLKISNGRKIVQAKQAIKNIK
jgi:hypothetical protein